MGIAGNQDDLGPDLARVQALDNAHFLRHGTAAVHGLRVTGLSGIIGRLDKNFRLAEAASTCREWPGYCARPRTCCSRIYPHALRPPGCRARRT